MITSSITYAKEVLDNGGVIALPTETVYGLAGNAFSADAVAKIFKLKNRPFYNPLIVHVADLNQLNTVAQQIPPLAHKLIEKFWPGPLTLLLKKQECVPDIVTANLPTVAVRMPNHPIASDLLAKLDYPLAAPSANPFGSISPTSSEHVLRYFGDTLGCILEGGNCARGIESTIIGFDEAGNPVLFRHGAISVAQITAVVGDLKHKINSENQPASPGMLSRHYAPTTKIILSNNIKKTVAHYPNLKIGVIVFQDIDLALNRVTKVVLSQSGDFEEAARNFYAALHQLDRSELDLIIAEEMPLDDLGISLNDRLNRAIKNK